jgi:hypothetical protein
MTLTLRHTLLHGNLHLRAENVTLSRLFIFEFHF